MSSLPKANAVNLGIFILYEVLRYGGMDRSEFGSPKLSRFICFVAKCESIACVDLYKLMLIWVTS